MSRTRPSNAVLVRQARLVPVGPRMRGFGAHDGPVDVRITDGTVSEVGPDLPVDDVVDVVDAAGRWAIPGLWDHHVHLTTWSRTRTTIDLAGTTGPADVTRRACPRISPG